MSTFLKNCFRYLFLLSTAPLCANFAYIGSGTALTITVVDTTTNSIVTTIPLGADPTMIAITPNNLYAYVTEISTNSFAVIETATNTFTIFPVTGGAQPLGIAITPNGDYAYVTNQGNGVVSVISTATNQVVQTIPGFVEPWGIAITPDGQFAYVVNLNSGTIPGYVTVINLSTNTISVPSIPVGLGPTAIAITANGQYAYVTNENDNTVSVISIATNTLVDTIPVGINPFEVTTSPNSQYVYVSNNAYTSPSNSSISVISTATNTVTTTIPLDSSGPADLAVTPDGQTLYVTNTLDTAVISTATNLVTGSIPSSGSSIAITGTLISALQGWQSMNDFAVIYEYFNHLQWQATPYSGVIGYNVYRNGEWIASLNANTFQYNDHNRQKNVPVTYLVAPIEASGQEGTPLSIVVN